MYTLTKFRALFITAISACACTSCYYPGQDLGDYIVPEGRQRENTHYVPSSPNTRFSSTKNDLSLDVQYSGAAKYAGVNVKGGFMISDRVGLIGGYSAVKNNDWTDIDYMRLREFELGIGLAKTHPSGLHIENYVGGGRGSIFNTHETGTSSVKYTRFFLQPGVAYVNPAKTFSIGLATRLSGVNFSVPGHTFDMRAEPHSTAQITNLASKNVHVFLEPGLRISAGWENLKFNAGYNMSTELFSNDLDYSKRNVTLGITAQLNTGK